MLLLWISSALAAPVAGWFFDGDVTDGISAYNGTVATGSLTYTGGAADFDGATVVTADAAQALTFGAGSISFVARVTPDSVSGTEIFMARYECGDFCPSGLANSLLQLRREDDRFSVRARDTTGRTENVSSANNLVAGETHTVVGSWDANLEVLRLIVDDTVYESSIPGFAGLFNDDGDPDPLTIGGRSTAGAPTYGSYFNGLVHYAVVDDAPIDSNNAGVEWSKSDNVFPTDVPCLPWEETINGGSATLTSTALDIQTTTNSHTRFYRHRFDDVDVSGPFWVEAEMRVLSSSAQSGWFRGASQLSACSGVGVGVAMEFRAGDVLLRDGDNSISHQIPLDTSEFHTYRIEVDPFDSTMELLIDGVSAATGPLWDSPVHCSSLGFFWGNASIISQGHTQWRRVSHNAGFGPDTDGDGWMDDCSICGDGTCDVGEGESELSCAVDCEERCNGVDDNLDGFADENNVCRCRTGSFLSSEYLACPAQTSFDSAQLVCENEGYSLLQLEDPVEDELIQRKLLRTWPQRIWWMGATDRAVEGSFTWLLGGPVTYNDWFGSQPDDFGTGQDCAGVHPASGGWYDVRCDRSMSFVCERPL